MTRDEDDVELLRRHAGGGGGAPQAFAELVRRHVDWVYSSALRQVRGDRHLAEDVTQAVFVLLARKCKSLGHKASLTGWLFHAVRYSAAHAVRAEARRRRHERRAAAMATETRPSPEGEGPAWERLAPALDELVARLRDDDRRAVLLRFYQRKSMAEVGAALGVSEDAAKKRVAKAVERLRALFAHRGLAPGGLALSTPALAATLLANTTHAAPTSAAAGAMTVAARGAASAPPDPPVALILRAAAGAMAAAKLKLAAAVAVAVLVPAAVGGAWIAGAFDREPGRTASIPQPSTNPEGSTGPKSLAVAEDEALGLWNVPLAAAAGGRPAADGRVWVLDLDEMMGLWVIPARLGLPAGTPTAVVLERAGRGDLYAADDGRTLIPARGTRLAPLNLPPVAGQEGAAVRATLARHTALSLPAGEVAHAVRSYAGSGGPVTLEAGRWYGLLPRNGNVLILLAYPTPDGRLILQLWPLGATGGRADGSGTGGTELPPPPGSPLRWS